MDFTLFFTDGFNWKIKTNRYAFPYFWSNYDPVLVAEYPEFKFWKKKLIERQKENLYVFWMRKFLPFSRKSFLLEKLNLILNLFLLKCFVLPWVLRGQVLRLWLFYPNVYKLASFFWPKKEFVYHVVDDLSEYGFWYKNKNRKEKFKDIENEVMRQVRIVLTTSPPLFKKATEYNANSFYIENGAYVNRLLDLSEKTKERFDFPRPICGFIGGIDDYRFDGKLLKLLANSFKNVSFVIAGPIGDFKKVKASNIYYLGYLNRKDISELIQFFSVGLMLYPVNSYTHSVFPVKLFEYFAFGLPVVTRNLPFTADYKNLLYVASSNEQYSKMVRRALNEEKDSLKNKRKEIALRHDWTKIVDKVYNAINADKEVCK